MSTDDGEIPRTFPELLIYLRDTYCIRVYLRRGQPIPDTFAQGYRQTMVAECLKAKGFARADQPLVSRMERGKDWPGKKRPAEKESFLLAAFECYAVDTPTLRGTLALALLMKSGDDGMPRGFVQNVWSTLEQWLRGQA